MSQRSSNSRVSPFVEHVGSANGGFERLLGTKHAMIPLYKAGSEVSSEIGKAVRPTLRRGHVNVKKVFDER
jgi:hypothetical protein